ncbi:MAG: SBBP repeat-containing protein, partial [candidate division Zixibacteria bacterium]|nr:SBBP repeat-containing protein [candidate division Zixibacteria bacterium]
MPRVMGLGLIYFLIATFSVPATAQVYEAWVAHFNGPASGGDVAYAVAVDDSGNVYVTGYSAGGGTSDDFATIKYNSNGDTVWVRRYNGPANGQDWPIDLAVNDSGNVYVTGYTGSFPASDYATIKYAPAGDTLWVRTYNGPGNSNDNAQAVALDDSGNLYVTGFSWGGASFYDYATVKYSSNGDSLWVKRYNGTGNESDQAHALAVDDSGNVYVAGGSDGSGTGDDYVTIKYAPNGDTGWVRRYSGPVFGPDIANALTIDDSGNVYVTGSSWNGLSDDYATIKYAPDGDTLWVRRYNGPGNGNDDAYAVGVDDSGNVYVTGNSLGSGTSDDYATIKYATNGDSLWVRRYNGSGNGVDGAYALELDSSGNVFVSGSTTG